MTAVTDVVTASAPLSPPLVSLPDAESADPLLSVLDALLLSGAGQEQSQEQQPEQSHEQEQTQEQPRDQLEEQPHDQLQEQPQEQPHGQAHEPGLAPEHAASALLSGAPAFGEPFVTPVATADSGSAPGLDDVTDVAASDANVAASALDAAAPWPSIDPALPSPVPNIRNDVVTAPSGAGVELDSVAASEVALSRVHDELDPDLLGVFLTEAHDLLPAIAGNLRRLAASPHEREIARDLMRQFHTVKGSARMAGAMRLGELVHDSRR